MRIALASNNAGKLQELSALLAPLGFELASQRELGIESAPEDAPTFVENALIKARHASLATRMPAIADDSGLVVDALDGAPGIHSARYAGPGASDGDNNRKLVTALGGRSAAAYYYCVLVYINRPEDPAPLIAIGSWHGAIIPEPRGSGGFGYDPHFYIDSLRRTAAELPASEKNRISHRGQACRALCQQLQQTR